MERPSQSRFRPAGRVILRALERLLGPTTLGVLLWPGAVAYAGARVGRGVSEMTGGPGPGGRLRPLRQVGAEARAVMTSLAWVFRDRFSAARWRGRLRLVNAGPVQAALREARPVVIATAHTEAMRLLVRLLCAEGVDAAMLVEDASRHSARFGRDAGDRLATRVIGISDLRGAVGFLRGPRVLVVPADAVRGRCVEVASPTQGVVGRFATGAARLAERSGAVCVSAVVVQTGVWRYETRFGSPVDAAEGEESATRLLGEQILELVIEHPECWSGVLRGAVRRAAPAGIDAAVPRDGERGHSCPSAA